MIFSFSQVMGIVHSISIRIGLQNTGYFLPLSYKLIFTCSLSICSLSVPAPIYYVGIGTSAKLAPMIGFAFFTDRFDFP